MPTLKPLLEIDGREGEGGGQLVRNSIVLAAVTSQPILITHIRGNRPAPRGSGGHRASSGKGSSNSKDKDRHGGRDVKLGGGLKAQHVSGIQFLASATGAEVEGLEIGSHVLKFVPRLVPSEAVMGIGNPGAGNIGSSGIGDGEKSGIGGVGRTIDIAAATPAASATLIFQAILPFLLFASTATTALSSSTVQNGGKDNSGKDDKEGKKEQKADDEDGGGDADRGGKGGDVITLTITGGTNVSFSPSYDYLSQVLIPLLETSFSPIRITPLLLRRGWNIGPITEGGKLQFQIHTIPLGQTLRPREPRIWEKLQPDDFAVAAVDITILAPVAMHADLERDIAAELDAIFPPGVQGEEDVKIEFTNVEDSGHDSRIYGLCVAKGKTGRLRWGRDVLFAGSIKKMRPGRISSMVAKKVCRELAEEIGRRNNGTGWGMVDRWAQDQVIVFQALAEGRTVFSRPGGVVEEDETGKMGGAVGVEHDDGYGDGSLSWFGEEGSGGGGGNEGLVAAMGELGLESEPKKVKKKTMPFGQGSKHSQTARWVASQILPAVAWYNDGSMCDGVGMSFGDKES